MAVSRAAGSTPEIIRTAVLLMSTAAAQSLLSMTTHAQCVVSPQYTQSEAVKQRYPDPPVRIQTPAFEPGKRGFTSHEQMMDFVRALASRADNVKLVEAGFSQEGLAIPALLLSSERRASPSQIRRSERPLIFLVGHAHGNEPAGGEALLAIAQSLASGELKPLLDRINVMIMPRLNPDGAHYFWRTTASCLDVDRDHMKVDLPETFAIRRMTFEFQPDVYIEAREFSVASRWIEKFNALQSYDFTFAYATHPNIAPALTDIADRVFTARLVRDTHTAGYSSHWSYTTAYDAADKRVTAGSTGPESGRNYAGLQNAIALTIATRGAGIGRDSFARRVHTHYTAITSVLRTTAENASDVRRIVRSARNALARHTASAGDDPLAVTSTTPTRIQKLTMLEAATGEPKEVEVDWADAREVRPGLTRTRPYAYLLLPSHVSVARRLAMSGMQVSELRKPTEIEIEAYEVTQRLTSSAFIEGHIRSTVATDVRTRKRVFPAGTLVYALAQPAANVLVAALEPESPAGFVALGMIPADPRGLANDDQGAPSELPIYRMMKPAPLDVEPARTR
jgi:hypothetical protein